jgi:hypothetical protein
MMNYLSSLSLWTLAIGITVFFVAIGIGSVFAARRWVLPWLRCTPHDAPYAATVIQSVILIYSLIAALTMIGVWQKHTQVSDIVSAEATAIAGLWHDLGAYPQPLRDDMRATLRTYTDQVIKRAWPMQEQGKVPREGVDLMYRLQGQLFPFEPTSEALRLSHAETLRAFNNLVQFRRQRLDSVQTKLPGVIWLVLIPGAIVCILLCALFPVESGRFQTVLMICVAGSISMVLFVIIALDRPFQGEMAIGPESYQLIYQYHVER